MAAYYLTSARIQILVGILRDEGAQLPSDLVLFLSTELPTRLNDGRYIGKEPLDFPLGGAFGETGTLRISAEKVAIVKGANCPVRVRDLREINDRIEGIACAPLVPRCDCPQCLWGRCHFCGVGPAPAQMMLPHKKLAVLCPPHGMELR